MFARGRAHNRRYYENERRYRSLERRFRHNEYQRQLVNWNYNILRFGRVVGERWFFDRYEYRRRWIAYCRANNIRFRE